MLFFRPRRFSVLALLVRASKWLASRAYEGLVQLGYCMTVLAVDPETQRLIRDHARSPRPAVPPWPGVPDDVLLTAQERIAWAELAAHLMETGDREPRGPGRDESR
ncbi:hypothetical protein [Actinoplanes sp. NPDC026619]|uniref:hypothetical protein n=1 Tax=Actinoplanes sp. NPDC026619 TaxID=3155798 RepID=UPI00340599FC